jgi:hypothetical protein
VEARNEIIEDPDNDGAVDGYEQLRRRALSGDTDGWRLGLGVMQHRGVAASLGVRTAMAPVRPTPTRPLPPATGGAGTAELVGLLASVALAVAVRGRASMSEQAAAKVVR